MWEIHGNPWKSMWTSRLYPDFPFNRPPIFMEETSNVLLTSTVLNEIDGLVGRREPAQIMRHWALWWTVMYCVCQRFIDIQNISESFWIKYSLGGIPKITISEQSLGIASSVIFPKDTSFFVLRCFFLAGNIMPLRYWSRKAEVATQWNSSQSQRSWRPAQSLPQVIVSIVIS